MKSTRPQPDREAADLQTPPAAGITFTETMRGHFSMVDRESRANAEPLPADEQNSREPSSPGPSHAPPENGAAPGASPFEFTVTVTIPDVAAMIADPEHRGEITGTVTAPVLNTAPLRVTRGEFRLFTPDPQREATRNMRYILNLAAESGKTYFLDGCKIVPGPGLHVWRDTSTLFITVYEGDGPGGTVVGRGILRIPVLSFLRQMTTLRGIHGRGFFDRMKAMLRFGLFFVRVLCEVYVCGKLGFGRRSQGTGSHDPPVSPLNG